MYYVYTAPAGRQVGQVAGSKQQDMQWQASRQGQQATAGRPRASKQHADMMQHACSHPPASYILRWTIQHKPRATIQTAAMHTNSKPPAGVAHPLHDHAQTVPHNVCAETGTIQSPTVARLVLLCTIYSWRPAKNLMHKPCLHCAKQVMHKVMGDPITVCTYDCPYSHPRHIHRWGQQVMPCDA